jgi:hypothetical protein
MEFATWGLQSQTSDSVSSIGFVADRHRVICPPIDEGKQTQLFADLTEWGSIASFFDQGTARYHCDGTACLTTKKRQDKYILEESDRASVDTKHRTETAYP